MLYRKILLNIFPTNSNIYMENVSTITEICYNVGLTTSTTNDNDIIST